MSKIPNIYLRIFERRYLFPNFVRPFPTYSRLPVAFPVASWVNAWQYDKYITLAHFYRPVAWHAGGWTFAVYSHYNRGHFYNDRPKVFVTYKGGNSHKHDRFYADRHVRSASPLGSSKNKTSRVPSVASDHRSSGHNNGHSNTNVNNDRGHNTGNGNHNTPNRQIAQNTNAHHSGSGHFGGRR